MASDLLVGSPPEGWERTTLGKVVERGGGNISTGPFGSQLHAADYVPYGVPSIMPVNIGENRIVENGIARITEVDANRLSRHRVRVGDIIYSRRGDVERRALVRKEQQGWLCGTGCLKVRLGKGITDPLFVSHYLGHPEVRAWIVQHAVGATMPNLNTAIMESIPFVLPPLSEQKAIACILGALDDKIEMNRRRNRTLEAMARAIFQSWFVDFDPVKAKAAGRTPPGLSADVAALFPSAFEESELGEIPHGWRVGTVGNNFRLTMGQSPPGDTYNQTGDGVPFYQGRTDFGFRFPDRRIYCSRPTRFAETGDTLVSVRAPVGDVNIATERCAVGRGVASVRHNRESRSLTFHAMRNLRSHFDKFEAEGTVFGSINKSDFAKLPFLESSDFVLDAFERVVAPIDNAITISELESRTLAGLRDALLPKLISGELRVADAEKIAGRML